MTDSSSCLNCQTPLKGTYCYECGQSTRGTDRFFLTLVNEAFEDIFSLNSRVWKTFGNLLGRPGYLSQEYFAGRRVRYIPPVRLYFTLSIGFFLVFSLYSFFEPQPIVSTIEQAQEANQPGEDSAEPSKPDVVAGGPDKDQPQGTPEGNPALEGDDEETAQEDDFFNIDLGDEEGEINLPWVSEEGEAKLKQRFEAQISKAKAIYKANPDAPSEYFREIAPPLIFCLLPLFALLLKLFYIFKRMYYTQHLILALHVHCFVFLWLTFFTFIDWGFLSLGGTPSWVNIIMISWCIFYLWRSLRVVYQQGRFATAIKFSLLSVCYLFLGLFALFVSVIFGIMTV